MPKFPVTFSRRKSTAENLENARVTEPSFRVLERPNSRPTDGGIKVSGKTQVMAKTRGLEANVEDNIFADLKPNRGSGSSNTTKTTSTDNSSRHSNTSTTPSSADISSHEEWRTVHRRIPTDIPVPPIPKSSSNGFLRAAGRTFSFGGQKKHVPSVPSTEESPPSTPTPPESRQAPAPGRSRATTASTATTLTPPRVDSDFDLDLGGDFGRMLLGNEKRASVATLKNDHDGRQTLAPRSLTGNRPNQPSPIQIDKAARVEASPYSWSSHHSNDQLLVSASPGLPTGPEVPPPVPRHTSPLAGQPLRPSVSPEISSRKPLLARQTSDLEHGEAEDEEARLLKDTLSTVTRFMSAGSSSSKQASQAATRYRRNEDSQTMTSRAPSGDDAESLFDTSQTLTPKPVSRFSPRVSSPRQSHKVMTPAEFEKYRKDKERQNRERQQDSFRTKSRDDEDDDEDNYEDDEDDIEKAKQQAKERRKQEAHMSVYRQQMMKVTGEAAGGALSRPSLQISFSTPNLQNFPLGPSPVAKSPENSDEDEEVPLAILAAHGFPNKNRPPTRLSTMMSNPNLRASQQPSYQRPGSAIGEASGAPTRLPAFARNLPQDPFLGAGLVRNSVRESFALGGGSAAASTQSGAPIHPGGLIGVIASEERSRAMRRGSPHIDGQNSMPGAPGFDPVAGIPPHMMYSNNQPPMMLTPGDQAQIQMTQQMQQFMQMQMQFMQMMTHQNGNNTAGPNSHMAAQSMASLGTASGMLGVGAMPGMQGMSGVGGPEVMRHSYVGHDSLLDLPSSRGDAHVRTMSMVQPSSASWIQPLQNVGYGPSPHFQGAGYAPSIAPSERSNVGLPGRYRPVSQAPPPQPVGPSHIRKSSTMSGALQPSISVVKSGNASDDDDEQGWEAMKAKREKKKSMWRSKKSIGGEISALIN
ncbi:hypothetical protein B0T17DRAFT_487040 [Bombardia bombarda]|uniref:Uncharacterized protein n=1 Tax=Bombardia bombarda TaxID=252184 RepID=A0AA39X724_9PEZI|nr:hypothetical protein B0T17DRAFT_487040 [Bombardia bombarda]